MKWFNNMKIGTKLIFTFVIVALIAGIVGVVGIININTINDNSTISYLNMTVPMSEVAEMSSLFQRIRVNTRDLVLENDEEGVNEIYNKILGYMDEFDSYALQFEKTIIKDDVREVYNAFLETNQEYISRLDELYKLALANKDEEAYDFIKGEMKETADELRGIIEQLVAMKVNGAQFTYESNVKTTDRAILIMVVIIIAANMAAIGLGIFISKIISNPVKKLSFVADKIADGDLDITIDIDSKDEIGDLANAFIRMADNLNEVMSNINYAADQVASGSKQVSNSSIALSQGATEQASAIEQLTASMEEISTQTRVNANNANEANSLADMAKENAIQGNLQMKDMLKAMDEINQSSNNISKIIKVIDEIAFQTNILALNAAVEAARAGQHGKGFAVVAEEVRNLAARSANAAKETTEMIEGSIKKVEDGTAIAKGTSNALNKIVDDVTKVASLIVNIASASNEQAVGIEQVNQGIMQVSQVVQTNSATSEESAAASEELSNQADMLDEQASKFKLRNSGIGRTSRRSMDTMNPEVIKLLDQMAENKNSYNAKNNSSKKIILSDNEFGKY